MQIVEILPGMGFSHVSHLLHEKNLIGPEWFFQLLGRVQQVDRNIIPGEYELHAGMKLTKMLRALVDGAVYEYSVTIPEGYNVVQIAEVLEEKGLARKEDILRLNRDPAFVATLHVDAPTLEGYMFPDTYQFARNMPPEFIVRAFVSRFHEMVTPELEVQAKTIGMTMKEVVTLASVIEERNRVSGRTVVGFWGFS